MIGFRIGKIDWSLHFCRPEDHRLMRSDGTYSVGVTDCRSKSVFVSSALSGAFLRRVLSHEIVHCTMFTYGIDLDLETEELLANIVAFYGDEMLDNVDSVMSSLEGRVKWMELI